MLYKIYIDLLYLFTQCSDSLFTITFLLPITHFSRELIIFRFSTDLLRKYYFQNFNNFISIAVELVIIKNFIM